MIDNILKLEANIHYSFRDKELLYAALSHSSVIASALVIRSFDRLEFLGDRVLNLLVAECLYKKFPTESEGDLAHRYTVLVCFETCADVAKRMQLDEFLDVAGGTSVDDRILGDALEAMIGAMYIDGGLAPCQQFVETNWMDLFLQIAPPHDPKSTLQEIVQSKGYPLPTYTVLEKSGDDHAPTFTVAVDVETWPTTVGSGPSKKIAEKDAASKLLAQMESAADATRGKRSKTQIYTIKTQRNHA
ncbi:MAG: ribonuclease III [Holosporales bacterium]|jgi:ribonuclease-3|nr:ribonuclease III [Holosporales bacterium]